MISAGKLSHFKEKSPKKIQTRGKTSRFHSIGTTVKSLRVLFFVFLNDVLEIHPTSPSSRSCRAHNIASNFCLLSWPFRLTIHQICSHLWGVNQTITRKPFTMVMDSRSEQEACFLQRDHFNREQNNGRTQFPRRAVWISFYKFYKNNPSKCLRRENLLKTECRPFEGCCPSWDFLSKQRLSDSTKGRGRNTFWSYSRLSKKDWAMKESLIIEAGCPSRQRAAELLAAI